MRIILFTGKGGVGKTTMAAATALRASQMGYKTLVISTDPAHSLSDALDRELGAEPMAITDMLHAQELDVYYSMRKYWSNMRQLIQAILRWQGVKTVLAEELSAIPGMEEASAFLWIEKYYSQGDYDLIVIDSAPTGETLTLLTLPQITSWWMRKAFPGQRFAIKSVGSLVRTTTGVPLDKGYEELEFLLSKLEIVQKVFQNPDICSIRIVANPEKMVIQEAKRAYSYLQLYGYNVDAIIVNRILPNLPEDSFFSPYLKAQRNYMKEIEDSFEPLPILRAGHLGKEVFGVELLNNLAEQLYEKSDPTKILFAERPLRVEETKDGYRIKIKVPFIEERDYSLRKFGDELVVDIGNRRRNLILPKFAKLLQLKNHFIEGPWLNVDLKK